MMSAAALIRNLWIAAVVVGLVFIASGTYMYVEGSNAKDDVRNDLVAEQITTSSDATIPDVLVNSYATARAEEAIIREHTLGRYGPYTGMERSDPNRETYIKGVALRGALNLAALGFKTSDLVMGIGGITLLLGFSHVLLIAPGLYFAGRAGQTREGPA